MIDNLEKAQLKTGVSFFDFSLLKYLLLFDQVGIIPKKDKKQLDYYINDLNDDEIRTYLLSKLGTFKKKIIKNSANEVGKEFIVAEIENDLKQLYKQLSFFEEE